MFQKLFHLFCFVFCTALLAQAQGKTNRLLFTADLDGSQEVPAVNTSARGLVSFLLTEDRSTIYLHGVFSGLSGPVTGCHIHIGAPGATGPVFTDFTAKVTGNRINAILQVPAGFIANALKNNLYFNVHTAANPSGEIRGALTLVADRQFAAILNGLEETPPVVVPATGVFRLTSFPGAATAHYIGSFNGLSGALTGSHIHSGAQGISGPVVTDLSTGLPGLLVGDLDLSALPADFEEKLVANQLYVNLHTAANPTGEIRGQLRSLGPITFESLLNGDQETPPVATGAIGTAIASLSPTLDTLTYFVSATGLTPTAAHLHLGAGGVAGPVIVALTTTPAPNFYTGKAVLTTAQLGALLQGEIYVNIHTAANPNGEIRGQLQSNIRRVYAFDLCGAQEAPAVNSNAVGSAVVSVDNGNTNLHYQVVADGLSGPATAAHFHTGQVGVSGPVLLPVDVPSPASGGVISINGNDAVAIENQNIYLNVHTAANPGGEIRGQVTRVVSCAENVSTQQPVIGRIGTYPNPTSGQSFLQTEVLENFDGQVAICDWTGRAVEVQNVSFNTGEQLISLNMSHLPAGVYVVQIRNFTRGVVGGVKLVKE